MKKGDSNIICKFKVQNFCHGILISWRIFIFLEMRKMILPFEFALWNGRSSIFILVLLRTGTGSSLDIKEIHKKDKDGFHSLQLSALYELRIPVM